MQPVGNSQRPWVEKGIVYALTAAVLGAPLGRLFQNLTLKEGRAMKILIAGPGCPRCQETEQNVFNACAELDLAADISHVYNPNEYSKLGVNTTPAVLVDGKVAVSGRVPTVDELKKLLSGAG